MPDHQLAVYLTDCRNRRGTGATTPETSLYSPLEALLNAAATGAKLKPRVLCFMNLKNQGAGMPDGGLFTKDQIAKSSDEPPPGQAPARGVIECKPPRQDVIAIADTKQVSDYWDRYNQVLVTNYREFLLIGKGDAGQPVRHEYYRLAASEKEFWQLAAHPEKAAEQHGDRLLDFLVRCLRRPAPLTDPKDVAWFLASYARDARGRVEHSHAQRGMETVRKALEDALGLKVTDAKGERFFQSTLVQTLFYGLFSAWVLWHRETKDTSDKFDWEKASKYLRVPILRKLFRELTDPAQLDSWDNLTEVMGWAADTLLRVDRAAFFAKFHDAAAVQYFYEPFLESFDPELRKQLGVWYTPPEIVKYMVQRVDQVLRIDFNRPDGLADPSVYVLDPCCGTGAYLVEVLNTIAATLADKGDDALRGGQLKQAATDRIFGFEILPAPFVVAHLQLGLFLQDHGMRFEGKERAAVFLTNSLTGWQPPTGPKATLTFPELTEERDKADRIKRGVPILVVLGNPPYNGFAGLPAEEEAGIVEPYRTTKQAPKPQGQGLNDLYVRFWRIAERCITERHAQHGIVCYISNYSWLDRLSHTGLRERFLEEFDEIWIDNLNGDKRETGKSTPDGKPDPSVFSTPHNREGIQVGTAIALLARVPKHESPATTHYREFWGIEKREALLASVQPFKKKAYQKLLPPLELGLPFRPMNTVEAYSCWPLLPALFPETFPGIFTARDQFVVDIDEKDLRSRVASYFDSEVSHEEMARINAQAMQVANRFDPVAVRDFLLERGIDKARVVPFAYRPFDTRWLYWEPETKLLNEKRSDYFPNAFDGNLWLAATQQNRKDFDAPIVLRRHATLHIIERGANLYPMLLRDEPSTKSMFVDEAVEERRLNGSVANLSDEALAYLNAFQGIADTPHLFHHAIATMHAPTYAKENNSALRQDWPRIPLPAKREDLITSAELGLQIAALLDPETPVAGVTAGKVRPELKLLGVAAKVGGGQLAGDDFAVAAHWGSAGKGGATMPGSGDARQREFSAAEAAALGESQTLLGKDTLDIYLNAAAYWRNVPRQVWEYTLGGYQVLKKWLSYREQALLGRPLSLARSTRVETSPPRCPRGSKSSRRILKHLAVVPTCYCHNARSVLHCRTTLRHGRSNLHCQQGSYVSQRGPKARQLQLRKRYAKPGYDKQLQSRIDQPPLVGFSDRHNDAAVRLSVPGYPCLAVAGWLGIIASVNRAGNCAHTWWSHTRPHVALAFRFLANDAGCRDVHHVCLTFRRGTLLPLFRKCQEPSRIHLHYGSTISDGGTAAD